MFSRINAIYLETKFNNFTDYSLLVKKVISCILIFFNPKNILEGLYIIYLQVIIHKNDAGDTYSYNALGRQWSAYSLLYVRPFPDRIGGIDAEELVYNSIE